MSKHIRIPCPNCRVELRARPEYLGQRGRCKHCGHPFRLWRYVRVPCPKCRSLLDIRQEYLNQWVSCKHCNHVFLAHSPDDPAQSPPLFTLAPEEQIAADESVTFEVGQMPSGARGRQSEAELGGSATLYAEALQQLESARDEIAWLLGQVQELQDQCDEMRAHQRAAEAAREDLLAARSELDALRAQAASWRDRAAEADRLETELGACRAEIERVGTELRGSLASVPVSDSHAASLTQELEAARVERDHLEAERQARECEVEQGRARLDEWERRLAEATTAHEADRDRPTRTLDESRNQSSAERQALESD